MTVTAAIVIATSTVYDMPGLLALAPWRDGETLVEYVVEQVLAAGVRDIEVVIPPDGDDIIPLVARDNVEPVIDSRRGGTASAIQIGATSLPRGTTDALIIDVAQPRSAALLRALIEAHEPVGAAVTRAAHAGEVGWPFIAGEAVLGTLRNVSDADGLARVLASFALATRAWACDDPVALLEIRSSDDLAQARHALSMG